MKSWLSALAAGSLIATFAVVSVPAQAEVSTERASKCVPAPKAQCAGADLRGVNLSGRNLRGINLSKANLTGANLKGTDLRGANLFDAKLVRADLRGARLKRADLREANFGKAKLHNTDFESALLNDGDLDPIVLPDESSQLLDLLDKATESIDIVIYEIGGPLIVGQAGESGKLMDAVSRGVKVRIIVNGGNAPCTYDDTTRTFNNQFECAQDHASWIYATQASLQYAYEHPNDGVTPIAPELNFSNNNFQITHQKTMLLDASYATGPNAGQPRPASDMLPTTMAVVSTGNLLSQYWGSNYDATSDAWQTDPASTCAAPNPPYQPAAGDTDCQIEAGARDFALPVTDPATVASISSVFFSDFFCGAVPPSTTPSQSNTNGLLTTSLPLAWSNGSLQSKAGTTPTEYPSAYWGYSYYDASSLQGNVRQLQLDLIKSAKTSLSVYNEEMADDSVIAELVAASYRLGAGKVKVVMTYGWNKYDDTINYYGAFSRLAAAGASIVLTQYASPGKTANAELYIHAKALIADGSRAYVGSTNIGTASMNFNRELGVMVTSSDTPPPNYVQAVQALSTLVTTFNKDFGDTKNGTPWSVIAGASAKTLPRHESLVAIADGEASAPTYTKTYPVLCGPLPTS
ncbi:MAG: pentapeptide repeat-containing protein [Candidatus Nanopelagicales bacterium]